MANNLSKIAILIFALLLVVNIFAVNNTNVVSEPDTVPVGQGSVEDTYDSVGGVETTTTEQDVVSAGEITTTTTTEYREEVDVELPYYIQVDKQKKVISIYTTNEEGKYEVLVRQMICSTEENKGKFPDGMYQLQANEDGSARKFEWRAMKSHGEDMFAQFAYTISGDFMFHSVPYENWGDHSSLYEWRYEELGTACTGGCIRLTVECAKWIYDNCPPGTPVEIMRSDSFDPELIEKLRPPAPVDGWDPTDPHPDNPAYQPMYDPDTEPKPNKYTQAYDYDFDWAPPCTKATARPTTTAAETTTTEAPAETTTEATSAPTDAPAIEITGVETTSSPE